jgi:hypothetical protein
MQLVENLQLGFVGQNGGVLRSRSASSEETVAIHPLKQGTCLRRGRFAAKSLAVIDRRETNMSRRSRLQASDEVAKLERVLIEASYLGLTLREYGRNNDFAYAEATNFIADLLVGWSNMISDRIYDGEDVFKPRGEGEKTRS